MVIGIGWGTEESPKAGRSLEGYHTISGKKIGRLELRLGQRTWKGWINPSNI